MTANLLADDLITVSDATGGKEQVSLPMLLHRLGSGAPTEASFVQPHQAHAVHALMTQLGALCVFRAGLPSLDASPDQWRAALLELSGGAAEPWTLVVENLSLPAFLQPPVPEGDVSVLKHETSMPDEIDVLITTRNHDLKDGRAASPRPEHWLWALVSMQTMSGFIGRGNYGIARMNSGYGTRCVRGRFA